MNPYSKWFLLSALMLLSLAATHSATIETDFDVDCKHVTCSKDAPCRAENASDWYFEDLMIGTADDPNQYAANSVVQDFEVATDNSVQLQRRCCQPCPPMPECSESEIISSVALDKSKFDSCCAGYECVKRPNCSVPGTQWRDGCRKCRCVTHKDYLCEADCEPIASEEHPITCYSESLQEPMLNGSKWLQDNNCTQCECINGEAECISVKCKLCERAIYVDGKCCPLCEEDVIQLMKTTTPTTTTTTIKATSVTTESTASRSESSESSESSEITTTTTATATEQNVETSSMSVISTDSSSSSSSTMSSSSSSSSTETAETSSTTETMLPQFRGGDSSSSSSNSDFTDSTTVVTLHMRISVSATNSPATESSVGYTEISSSSSSSSSPYTDSTATTKWTTPAPIISISTTTTSTSTSSSTTNSPHPLMTESIATSSPDELLFSSELTYFPLSTFTTSAPVSVTVPQAPTPTGFQGAILSNASAYSTTLKYTGGMFAVFILPAIFIAVWKSCPPQRYFSVPSAETTPKGSSASQSIA